jgi:hypothetical protein
MNNSNLAQTKTLLADMAVQARELSSAAGGSVTDAVAGWLAARYASAAHEKLAGADAARQWEVLRMVVQDWHLLRHGDHVSERLRIEGERVKLARDEVQAKCRDDEQKALEVTLEESKQFPEVREMFRAAFTALKKHRSNK